MKECTSLCSLLQDHHTHNHQNTPNTLSKFIEYHLKLPKELEGRVHAHIATDLFQEGQWAKDPVGPRRNPNEYLIAKHVIFLFLSTGSALGSSRSASPLSFSTSTSSSTLGTSSRRRMGEGKMVILGMTAWEYAKNDTRQPIRSFIQYLDTSGLCRPRRLQGYLTKAIVDIYFSYCRQVCHIQWIHLFSHAQPSLIFNGSEYLARKRILDSAKLIYWWITLISANNSNLSILPPPSPCQAFIYCPAEEYFPLFVADLQRNLHSLNQLNVCPLKWIYGVPYSLDDPADLCIPRFEDDPKWRHFEAAAEGEVCWGGERGAKRHRRNDDYSKKSTQTVAEFFHTLSLRSEFHSRPTALISINITPEEGISPASFKYPADLPKNQSEIAQFSIKLLKTLKFDTEADAIKSSLSLWSWLKIKGSIPIELRCCEEGDQTDNLNERLLRITQSINTASISLSYTDLSTNSNPANDVQSLIRRKFPQSI